MIPSDHFVRFYNEVFKFLEKRGLLQAYFDDVARYAASRNLEKFKNGLQGVYDHYLVIRKEENCYLDMELADGELHSFMRKCPSLSKVLDNDAPASPHYCLHCPGWSLPVNTAAGLYEVYDLMEPDVPHCESWLYDDPARALARYRELLKTVPASRIRTNLPPELLADGEETSRPRSAVFSPETAEKV